MGIRVRRAAAQLVMCGVQRSVRADGVALEARGLFVEVDVAAVLQAKVGTAGEHKGKVCIAMAVAVAHAAAEESHCGAEERLAAHVLGLREPGEEVAKLLDGEGVVLGELLHVAGIAAVVAELMARLGDADLGNGDGISFSPQAEGGHARHIRLEGEHHEVIHGAEIIARQGGGDVAVGALAVGVGDDGQRRVEPCIGAPRADLRLADGGEVLLHASLVPSAHLFLELAHFGEVGVEHTTFAAQGPALDRFAALRFFEEGCEDFTATTHRGQPHAVCCPSEGILRDGDLHRWVTGERRGHLGHLLVHGDGVAVGRAELSAGEPDVDAVVVVAERSWVMQPADGRDDCAVLLQWLQRPGELVILSRRGDLVVQRVNAIGEVDEDAALWRGSFLRRPQRHHTFQHRQRDESADGTKGVTAIHQPGL